MTKTKTQSSTQFYFFWVKAVFSKNFLSNFLFEKLKNCTWFLMNLARYFKHIIYKTPPDGCLCSTKKYFAMKY